MLPCQSPKLKSFQEFTTFIAHYETIPIILHFHLFSISQPKSFLQVIPISSPLHPKRKLLKFWKLLLMMRIKHCLESWASLSTSPVFRGVMWSQNKVQWLVACGHVSASSQSLRFVLSLRMNSSFKTSRPDWSLDTDQLLNIDIS